MNTPLLESKIRAPRARADVVRRDRLARRFDPDRIPSLTLVSAPAGFGKTTLVIEWLSSVTSDSQVAWLSLDRRDSDPARYWAYVVAALRRAGLELGAQSLASLEATPSDLDAVVAPLLNDLAGLDRDVVLVLDDYQLIDSLDVQESMRFLLEHQPSTLHLVVASRADPPWSLANLRARGELVEVRAKDLRFTVTEAAAYLRDSMGLELSSGDVEVLEGRTEGWIAALQLAALSLRGREDASAFVAGFAGGDRFVVDYLMDEVLDRQPPELRSFLLETSILNRLSGSLCAAVTGRDDAIAMLDSLDRANLFLIALDDQRGWYRFHHLFGEVLRMRITIERPTELAGLHRRASAWFQAAGDYAEALHHALAAEDYDKAAELVELGIPSLRRARQDVTMQEWFDALPPEVFANRPVLNLDRVGARMVRGDTAGVASMLDDVEVWLGDDRPESGMIVHDEVEFRRLPAQVAIYRAALALLSGDLETTRHQAQRAAKASTADDHLSRGAAAALDGLTRWTDGDLASAAGQYSTAITELRHAGFWADILGSSLALADIQVGLGKLGEAESTLRAGLDLDSRHGPLRGVADMDIALAEIHLERNQLDEAADLLRTSLEVGASRALAQHAHRWRIVAARLQSIAGEHNAAKALLAEADKLYETDFSPKFRPIPAVTARIQLAAGDLASARRWAAGVDIPSDQETSFLHEYEQLTVARVLLAAGQGDDALPQLGRIHQSALDGGRQGSVIESQVFRALALDQQGDEESALEVLAGALEAARHEGYVRVFLDAGAEILHLLERGVRQDRIADLALPILAAAHRTPTASAPTELIDPLSRRELDVLRLLRTDLSGPEIAAELIVSLNTVRTHTKNIYMKLGVTNRRSAIRRADQLGL